MDTERNLIQRGAGARQTMRVTADYVHDFLSGTGETFLSPVEMERLSSEYAMTRDPHLRDTLVLYHQRLVRSIASRYLGSEETLEDLIQVGNIGLINALDRFDPAQGTRFSTYATPTILGEIRRHFRDKSGGIKIPRWLLELQQAVRKVIGELTQTLGRLPSEQEVAHQLSVPEEHVLLALASQEAANLASLDARLDSNSALDSATLADILGRLDQALCEFESFSDLRTALGVLGSREREVIALRFFDDLSQAKIALRLNISQMHVSRLQQRALKHLRDLLSEEPLAPPPRRRRAPRSVSL